ARGLQGSRARLVARTLDEFRRNGAELDAAGKARLAALSVELSSACTAFGQNVLDATNAVELWIEDERKLAGLPPTARPAARASAQEKGRAGFRLTLQAPSYLAAMTYLDDGAIRERLWRAYNTRAAGAGRDNRPLVAQILSLRREKARLLGYQDFADL